MTNRAVSKLAGAALAVIFTMAPKSGQAQWIVSDPTLELTQIQTNETSLLNEAKEIATQANQYLNEINQYTLQIQQFENQVQNTLLLPAAVMGQVQGVVNHAMAVVGNMQATYQRANGIAITAQNLDQQFQLRFPGYGGGGTYPGYPTTFQPSSPMQQVYAARTNGTLDSIRGAMAATAAQVNDVQTEMAAVQQLQSMSAASVSGTVQAIQAAHQIALHQVDQIDKLQGLVAGQSQAQMTYFATTLQNHQDSKAAEDQFLHPVQDSW